MLTIFFMEVNEMDKMPKNENLDMIFLIDRSGSMCNSVEDTIGGFNSYLKRGKDKNSNVRVTTILFDNGYDVLYTISPPKERLSFGQIRFFVKNGLFPESVFIQYTSRGDTQLR